MVRPHGHHRGAVLLEVVLAMAIFVSTMSVVYMAFYSSRAGLRMVRLNNQAADLAYTVMSEIHLGLIDKANNGPNDYGEENPELEGWEWQVTVETITDTGESESMQQVIVTITNLDENITSELVELMAMEDEEPEEEEGPEFLP